jgi:transposase
MTMVKSLYDYFEGTEKELQFSVIADLFGYINWTKEMNETKDDTIAMFLGLYKGLYMMNVSYQEIYRCFLENRLDELIHNKYSLEKSTYYEKFCEKNIKIGKTFVEKYNTDKTVESQETNNNEPIICSIQPPYPYNNYK